MKPWEIICQELLFKPIGAESLTFKMPGKQIPVSITPQPPEGPYNPAGFNDAIAGHPAGSAFGTCADLLKVLHLHLNRGVWEGKTLIKPETLKEMHTVQYSAEIDSATKAGKPPAHEKWGLGILLRGTGPAQPAHGWFGMGDVETPGVFGHAGIDTIIAVADPEQDVALVFLTTDSPKPSAKVSPLRSGVVAKAFAGLG
jgi:CubicO group peptidase (beta-lactamase class C family)